MSSSETGKRHQIHRGAAEGHILLQEIITGEDLLKSSKVYNRFYGSVAGPDLGGGPWGPGPQASHQEKASHHLKYAILLFIMPLNLKAYFIKFILTYLLPYLVHVKMLSLVVVY